MQVHFVVVFGHWFMKSFVGNSFLFFGVFASVALAAYLNPNRYCGLKDCVIELEFPSSFKELEIEY